MLLYAYDTLIIGTEEAQLQQFLDAVAHAGSLYGMELHRSKFQLIQVNRVYTLRTPGGDEIPAKQLMSYLGAAIYADGGVKSELNQTSGAAWGDFSKLNRLWKHAVLPATKKIRILQAVVTGKLLYGLSSAWLNEAEVRRLDGFYCRCLRAILRIPPSFVSRVSNVTGLQQASQPALGRQLR